MSTDRINELYEGKIFAKETQLTAQKRIHWICRQAKGQKVLDIGCSQGIICLLLGREGFDCIGVDHQKEAIDYAIRELDKEEDPVKQHTQFQLLQAKDLPFEDGVFDTVVLGEILEHLTHPQKVLKEAKRVLKDTGIAIITVPFGLHPDPDHKRTYYPRTFLHDVQPFFRTNSIDLLDNYIVYTGTNDASYDFSKASEAILAKEKLILQEKLEVRYLANELALLQKSQELHDQNRIIEDRVKTQVNLKDREFRKALAAKDKKLENANQTLADKEAELQALNQALNQALATRDKELRASNQALADKAAKLQTLNQALATRDEELRASSQALADKAAELQTLNQALANRDEELRASNQALADKDRELERQLNAKDHELKFFLNEKSQESQFHIATKDYELRKEFKKSWTWRIGSAVVIPCALISDFVKHPIQFAKDFRNRVIGLFNHFYQCGPPPQKRDQPIEQGSASPTAPSEDRPNQKALVTTDEISFGCILDEFTNACFNPECKLITFRPDNWKETLERDPPQAVFVESAWRGNDGSWQYRVAKYQKNMGDELHHLLTWAKIKNIPTVFWNKEDPPHYDRFIDNAKLFDYVFTSDANCIQRYRKELGHDRIFALPFAAQPNIHNPIVDSPRERSVCFAGTYYGKTHEERRQDMEHILKPALEFGLHIYDRQFGMTGPDAAQFQFPDIYQPSIKGRLDYEDMVKAYKQYKVFLNVNSIKTSPTMFSRRVFELLACGTPVISTYSKGIVDLLGDDMVLITESESDTKKHLERLLNDGENWSRLSVKGIRKVMEDHTYNQRLKFIADSIGLSFPASNHLSFTAVSKVTNAEELAKVQAALLRQTYQNFEVALFLEKKLEDRHLEGLRNALPGKRIESFPLDAEMSYEGCLRSAAGDYFVLFNPNDYYGANYLRDYALAAAYSGCNYIGKHSHFVPASDGTKLQEPGLEFQRVSQVPSSTLAVKKKVTNAKLRASFLGKDVFVSENKDIFSVDRYNFVKLYPTQTASPVITKSADL